MLLLLPPDWVIHADLGRIDVEHPPRDCPVKNLSKRPRCFEAVAG
jgi:hypothetical protein